ncbi:MAG: Flp pilus assembly complex ATPase component TadA [Lachnospiraceae bacterium]|nr:Flp pilus assembly complex ATPase component TadA [Lachnospiraceae bacterium]
MALFGKRVRIGDLLMSQGLITEQQLETALEEQKIRKTKLGETLLALGYVSQEDFADVLSRQLGIDSVDLHTEGLQDAAIKLVPEDIMKKYELVPFAIDENNSNVLKVAMADPMFLPAIDDVSIITNMEVKPYFATTAQIAIQLDRMFGKKQAMEAAEQYQKEHANEFLEEEEAANVEVDNAPIVKIVRTMLEQAVRQGASDIHVEPLERMLRVRYRIDGALREVMDYNTTLLPAMVARIKIMSGLDISEKRKPQDGRLTLHVDNKEYDVRVSILPTVFGEKTVMRLTAKDGLSRDKKYLGLTPEDEERLDDILKNPHGIILVTGPTGSGKSTTCYTVLNELNREEVNIITVEDPVEANVDGVNQVQVNTKADLTFASALRSILRQDPDIIMIGEIRDGETAGIAVKASITGHLVISTLHTNSTAASITRMIDMGVEPYLIGDSVVGIIAQRLVRKLCPACKRAKEATAKEKQLLGVTADTPLMVYEPRGCEACGGIGYKGRTAIYEIMTVTNKLRSHIHGRVTAEELKDIAVSEGMNTLRMAASKKVQEGITSVAEMIKVAYEAD